MQQLHASLVEAGRRGHAATLLSGAAQGTGRWIYSQYYVGRRFTEAEYREPLRNRVLSTFEPPLGRGAIVCHCGANGGVGYDLVREPLHPTICKWNGHIINKRHHGVRDALCKALRCMHPEARLVVEPMDADNPVGLPVRRPECSFFFFKKKLGGFFLDQ